MRRARLTRALRALPVSLVVVLIAASAAAPADGLSTTLIYPPFGHCLGLHRATSFHLFLYLGTRTEFNEPAGLAAVKLREHDDPASPSDDDELTVFGLNSGECEIIYNTSLYNVEVFGEPGSGPGQFMEPLGIAADELGNVYVADTGNDRIVALRYRGGDLEFIREFLEPGPGAGMFEAPSQVALGRSGLVYVTDTGNDRLVVMTPSGKLVSEMRGGTGEELSLTGPTGLAVVESDDPWTSRRRDAVLVSDRGGTRLLSLDADGNVVSVAEASDLPYENASFDYLGIDFYGSIYATDRRNSTIHKLDWRLDYLTSVGSHGTGDMELDEPRGITIWRRFGQIFVTERAGAQYFWIGTEIVDAGLTPGAAAPGERVELRYRLTEVSRVTLEVVGTSGDVVATPVSGRRRAIGDNVERWDCTLGRGGPPAPPGNYTLRLTAAPTYSSGEYFQDTAELVLTVLRPSGP
jgi:DNA-binding beta-propeller fold protein YncE